MGGGGWKRVAFGGNKKGLCERKAFGFPKKLTFSVHAKQTEKEKLFQHTKISISHRTKANVQKLFSNIACHCKLAVQQSIFEK